MSITTGIGIRITDLTFSDGSKIECDGYEVILVVGPNNAGKTKCLLEIYGQLLGRNSHHKPNGVVLKSLSAARRGAPRDIWEIIRATGIPQPAGQDQTYQIGLANHQNAAVDINAIKQWEDEAANIFAERLFTCYLSPSGREQLSDPQETIDFGRQAPHHPLHFLYEDRIVRRRLADEFRRAFGLEIGIDLMAGKVIPIHVGEHAAPKDGESEYDPTYRNRVRSYPRLNEQGHGMRSFVGILLNCWSSSKSVIIIDEPETFLHPPQAKVLARSVVKPKEVDADGRDGPPVEKQLIIATHSTDIIKGVLESPGVRTKIIRLRREGDKNIARELAHEGIQEVWADPVLRYSNILDGLFYERVVVCESDGDCRFYQAIADSLRENDNHEFLRDIMFAQAGGKGGMPKLIRALKRIEVPVIAVVDFDLLREQNDVAGFMSSLGGSMETLKVHYDAVRQNIDKIGKASVADVKRKIAALLDGVPDTAETLPAKVVRSIIAETRTHIGWQKAKSSGVKILDRGQPSKAGQELLGALSKAGLLVVPCGELESFDPVVATEKNQWVNAVLEKYRGRFSTAPELDSAREFVKQMIAP